MSGPCTDCGGPDYQTLEARIAELEAERKELRQAMRNLSSKYNELSAKNERLLGSVEISQEALKNQRDETEMVPARGPGFGDGVWERRQDNPPGAGIINDVIPPDRVEDGEE